MDLRHLRTFVAVAEQGTVSKASTLMNVAQPALSRQIKDLEVELGVQLFDRVRRRLFLTTDGKQLLDDCRSILAAVASLRDHAQLLRRADAGILKVAATPQTIDGVLSSFLPHYARHRPNVQIRLNEGFGAALPELLLRGEVHLIITTAGALRSANHAFGTIALPPLEFVAAHDPALRLGNRAGIDVRALAAHPLLLLDRSFAVRLAFDAACRVAEFEPNVAFESRTPHTLLAMAEAGHGVAIVPSVLPTHRYKLRIARLTYRHKPIREGYGIVFDRRRSLPAAAADFSQALVTYVREIFPISRPSQAKGDARRNRRGRDSHVQSARRSG